MRFAWVLIEVWLGGADGGLHICGGWRQVQLGWLSIEVRLDRGPSLLQLQCARRCVLVQFEAPARTVPPLPVRVPERFSLHGQVALQLVPRSSGPVDAFSLTFSM